MILLRHGQSEFNVVYSATGEDPGIPDPALTELGREQAGAAASALAGNGVTRIVTSPYTRALETAGIVADRLGLGFTVEPLVGERYGFTCDVGSPRSAIEARWPNVSFGHIDEHWWPEADEPDSAVAARCDGFRALAAGWDDHRDVLVVSHWGFILELTGVSAANAQPVEFHPD